MSAKRSIYNEDKANAVFAVKIRKLFEESGKTHNNLAEYIEQRLGESVTRQAVGQWCNGNTCPNLRTVPIIAEFFGVSTDYLLTDTEIRTTDAELKAVCEYTGLSETAIIKTKTALKEDFFFEELNIWVSRILQSDAFWDVANLAMEHDHDNETARYLECIESALDEVVKSEYSIENKKALFKSIADIYMLNCQQIYEDEEYRRNKQPDEKWQWIDDLFPETYYLERLAEHFCSEMCERLEIIEYRASKKVLLLMNEINSSVDKTECEYNNGLIISAISKRNDTTSDFVEFVKAKLNKAIQESR